MISIIAGIGKNRELGKNNELLWHIPEDLAYFKKVTSGAPVIMGRATYLSLPEKFRPLPGRTNIVLTLPDEKLDEEGILHAHSFEEAYELGHTEADEIFVIGGGSVYAQALPDADRLYLTLIEAEDPDADVFFPEYTHLFTKEVSRETHNNGEYTFHFTVLEK